MTLKPDGPRDAAEEGAERAPAAGATSCAPSLRLVIQGLSDVGLRRRGNEDSLLVRTEMGLIAVADGMGGHAAGEVASRITVEVVEESLRATAGESPEWPLGYDEALSLTANRLLTALRLANRRVIDASRANRNHRGMASTAVVAILQGEVAHVAHAGDSRAYLWRHGRLRQITIDHSYVSERVQDGSLTPEEARIHPLRNMVTRAVGGRPEIEVDVQEVPLDPGDTLLLCSDGLSGMLPDERIAELLAAAGEHPEEAAEALVAAANDAGGDDNITVLLARACRE